MYQTIAMPPVTLRRLLNYQRVTENKAKAAYQQQWIDMAPANMLRCEVAKQQLESIGAIVAYAGFLFRVQNKMMSYTVLPNEYLLHNALVELMGELRISIKMVDLEISDSSSSRADFVEEDAV